MTTQKDTAECAPAPAAANLGRRPLAPTLRPPRLDSVVDPINQGHKQSYEKDCAEPTRNRKVEPPLECPHPTRRCVPPEEALGVAPKPVRALAELHGPDRNPDNCRRNGREQIWRPVRRLRDEITDAPVDVREQLLGRLAVGKVPVNLQVGFQRRATIAALEPLGGETAATTVPARPISATRTPTDWILPPGPPPSPGGSAACRNALIISTAARRNAGLSGGSEGRIRLLGAVLAGRSDLCPLSVGSVRPAGTAS